MLSHLFIGIVDSRARTEKPVNDSLLAAARLNITPPTL